MSRQKLQTSQISAVRNSSVSQETVRSVNECGRFKPLKWQHCRGEAVRSDVMCVLITNLLTYVN